MGEAERHPVRRELVVEEPLTEAEVRRRWVSDEPRYLRKVLVRRAGSEEFRLLRKDQVVAPGDTLRIWNVDSESDADMEEASRSYNDTVYLNSMSDAWPDEREVIEAIVPPRGARVLDVCCGAGRVAPYLVRAGNTVVGVDLSRDSIEFAAATDRHGIEYVVGDVSALPFPDAAFDIVCGFENMPGIVFGQKRLAGLDEMFRVTRPGGTLIIGFREEEDGPLRFYHSLEGLVELAQTWTRRSAAALLDSLPAPTRARIRTVEHRPGHLRPWGGTQLYFILRLA